MKLDITGVRFSSKDRIKGIQLPRCLSTDLAEDIGIHIGDGSLYVEGPKKQSPVFVYSSHVEEKDYFRDVVICLKKKLFNLKKYKEIQVGNEYRIRFFSLALCIFYSNVLGLPLGKKSGIVDIPQIIMKSEDKKIKSSCIRGIVDTDFTLKFVKKCKYPMLRGAFASEKLVTSLKVLFDGFGITSCTYNETYYDKRTEKTYTKFVIQISGRKNLKTFIDEIGFHNPRHLKKVYLHFKTN